MYALHAALQVGADKKQELVVPAALKPYVQLAKDLGFKVRARMYVCACVCVTCRKGAELSTVQSWAVQTERPAAIRGRAEMPAHACTSTHAPMPPCQPPQEYYETLARCRAILTAFGSGARPAAASAAVHAPCWLPALLLCALPAGCLLLLLSTRAAACSACPRGQQRA